MVFSLPPLLLSRRLVGPVEFVAHCQIAIRMPQTRQHDPAADIGGAYGAVRDGASRSTCVNIKRNHDAVRRECTVSAPTRSRVRSVCLRCPTCSPEYDSDAIDDGARYAPNDFSVSYRRTRPIPGARSSRPPASAGGRTCWPARAAPPSRPPGRGTRRPPSRRSPSRSPDWR